MVANLDLGLLTLRRLPWPRSPSFKEGNLSGNPDWLLMSHVLLGSAVFGVLPVTRAGSFTKLCLASFPVPYLFDAPQRSYLPVRPCKGYISICKFHLPAFRVIPCSTRYD